MQEVVNQLIKETENKIIGILIEAYNSGRIEEDGFNKYEMNEIKKLLFMRSELDDKLYNLLEGDLARGKRAEMGVFLDDRCDEEVEEFY